MSKLIGYFTVAGIGLVVDSIVYFSLIYLVQLNYLIAGASGFIIGFIINFSIGRNYVFTKGYRYSVSKHEFYSVFFISLIALCVHQIILYLAVDNLGFSVEVSKLFAIVFSFFFNYFGRRHIYS